jgi:hypothetical protein
MKGSLYSNSIYKVSVCKNHVMDAIDLQYCEEETFFQWGEEEK